MHAPAAPAGPALSSTCSILAWLAGLGGTIGRRQTGSSRPISAMAALTGMGFDSTKLISISGRYWRCRSCGRRRNRSPERELRQLASSRAGISFETTEMMPRPPSAISGMVMASSPERTVNVRRNLVDHRGHLADVARRFLHADDVVDLRQALQRGRLDVDAGAALHAVDDDRQRDAGGDRFVVLIQAFLRGLVVVRRDGEDAVARPAASVRARARSLRAVL